MMKAVKVFVITFALQLTLPVQCQFNFGDLIKIDMESVGNPPMPVYVHWAIYVGNNTGLENIKQNNKDIFTIYGGDITEVPYCVFDTLSEIPGTPMKFNYMDKNSMEHGHNVVKIETMIEKIKLLHKKCIWWDPVMSSCEHVLVYVRYGDIGQCKLTDAEEKNKRKRSPSFNMV